VAASPTPAHRSALRRTDQGSGRGRIAHNPDYNGAQQDGIAMSQATIASAPPHEHRALLSRPIRNAEIFAS